MDNQNFLRTDGDYISKKRHEMLAIEQLASRTVQAEEENRKLQGIKRIADELSKYGHVIHTDYKPERFGGSRHYTVYVKDIDKTQEVVDKIVYEYQKKVDLEKKIEEKERVSYNLRQKKEKLTKELEDLRAKLLYNKAGIFFTGLALGIAIGYIIAYSLLN